MPAHAKTLSTRPVVDIWKPQRLPGPTRAILVFALASLAVGGQAVAGEAPAGLVPSALDPAVIEQLAQPAVLVEQPAVTATPDATDPATVEHSPDATEGVAPRAVTESRVESGAPQPAQTTPKAYVGQPAPLDMSVIRGLAKPASKPAERPLPQAQMDLVRDVFAPEMRD